VDYPERGRRIGRDRRALVTIWPYLIGYRIRGDVTRPAV
jgi:hypothetical protein